PARGAGGDRAAGAAPRPRRSLPVGARARPAPLGVRQPARARSVAGLLLPDAAGRATGQGVDARDRDPRGAGARNAQGPGAARAGPGARVDRGAEEHGEPRSPAALGQGTAPLQAGTASLRIDEAGPPAIA